MSQMLRTQKVDEKTNLNLNFQIEYLLLVSPEIEKSGGYEISIKSAFSGKLVFDYSNVQFSV